MTMQNLNPDYEPYHGSGNFTPEEIASHEAVIADGYDGMAVNVMTVATPTNLDQSEADFLASF